MQLFDLILCEVGEMYISTVAVKLFFISMVAE